MMGPLLHDPMVEDLDMYYSSSFTLVGGGSTWEPERKQETSFGGTTHTSVFHKKYLVGETYELIGNKTHQRLEPNLSLFKLGEDGRLYYKGKPLTNRNGELKTIGVIADTLGIRGLREMGYNITKTNLKPRFVLDLMEKQAKLPSPSEIAKQLFALNWGKSSWGKK